MGQLSMILTVRAIRFHVVVLLPLCECQDFKPDPPLGPCLVLGSLWSLWSLVTPLGHLMVTSLVDHRLLQVRFGYSNDLILHVFFQLVLQCANGLEPYIYFDVGAFAKDVCSRGPTGLTPSTVNNLSSSLLVVPTFML